MLKQLRSWIFETPTRIYLRSDQRSVIDETSRNIQVVLSRGLCQYTYVDLSSVAREQRQSAINLHVLKVSPFSDFDFHANFRDGIAEVWFWDTGILEELFPASEGTVTSVLPATLLAKRSEAQSELVEYSDGFEARYWHEDGWLQSSRWWKKKAEAGEIATFLKGMGSSNTVIETVTKIDDVALTNPDSGEPAGNEVSSANVVQVAGYFLALFATMFLVWESAAIAKLSWQSWQLSAAVQELEGDSESQFADRNTVYRVEELLDSIQTIRSAPPQVALKVRLEKLLEDNIAFVAWKYSSRELHITLRSEGEPFDLVTYSRLFDESADFSVVDVRRGKDESELLVQLEVIANDI